MDSDDDGASQVPRRNRFVPRSSKTKSKLKSQLTGTQEPPQPAPKTEHEKPELKPKKEQLDSLILEKKEGGVDDGPKTEDFTGGFKMETDEAPKEDDPMEEAEAEDTVVREIDVFFNPQIDKSSQLYVLQYPLRPEWRPYDLENRCEEVRLKPATSEMEMDLSLDLDPRNYDEDYANRLKITKQILSTTWMPTRTSSLDGHAVGVMTGNELHLNPITAVVQLRPSFRHLKSGGSKRNNSATGDAEVTVKLEESRQEKILGSSKKQSKQKESSTDKKPENEESWVPLQYHGSESDFSARYLQGMALQESSPIQFTMSPYDYVNALCPRTCDGSSRRFLLSLPLEERIKKLFVKEPVARRFSFLKNYFAPDHTAEELMDVLQRNAHLLLDPGLWVPKTSLLYPSKDDNGVEIKDKKALLPMQTSRNYILNLFRKNPIISNSELDLPMPYKTHVQESLEILAVPTPNSQDWKLKEQPDISFKELYPDIIKSEEKKWEDMEEKLVKAFKSSTVRGTMNASMTSKLGKSLSSDKGATKGANEVHSGGRTMSDETRAVLGDAIKEFLKEHKVCKFQQICDGLRNSVLKLKSLPKVDPKSKKVTALEYGVQDPPELQNVINQVAVDVHGLYVLKSSPEHPEHDRLRKVVIDLLNAKGANAKLKKGEVFEAAKITLGREINNTEYNKVMTDFCVFKGSAWILKSNDGGPN